MEKKYILYDMDGTLINSYEGVINAFVYALNKAGIPPRPETFRRVIGPPLEQSFREFYGIEGEDCRTLIRYFREYYTAKGIHELFPYDGVLDMLSTLNAHGKKLMIATAKPEFMAEAISEDLGFAPYMCFTAGVTTEFTPETPASQIRTCKKEVIEYILKVNDIKDTEHAVMIGDRASDIHAARELGLDTIGVLYGFGSKEELEEAGAGYLAESPADITGYIIDSE